jgi:hypothetical protein
MTPQKAVTFVGMTILVFFFQGTEVELSLGILGYGLRPYQLAPLWLPCPFGHLKYNTYPHKVKFNTY